MKPDPLALPDRPDEFDLSAPQHRPSEPRPAPRPLGPTPPWWVLLVVLALIVAGVVWVYETQPTPGDPVHRKHVPPGAAEVGTP